MTGGQLTMGAKDRGAKDRGAKDRGANDRGANDRNPKLPLRGCLASPERSFVQKDVVLQINISSS